METKKNFIAGFLLILASLSGATINELVDSDSQLYYCQSKDIISDCVNGIKADGLRCYYNESNGRAYSYCREGWESYIIEGLKENINNENKVNNANKYVCSPSGCEIK